MLYSPGESPYVQSIRLAEPKFNSDPVASAGDLSGGGGLQPFPEGGLQSDDPGGSRSVPRGANARTTNTLFGQRGLCCCQQGRMGNRTVNGAGSDRNKPLACAGGDGGDRTGSRVRRAKRGA